MEIDELLIEFDEMGFAPTTLCKNPEEYACEWKKQLVVEIENLKILLAQANAGNVNCGGCALIEQQAVKKFAEKLKETAFRMSTNSNEKFIYAQNVDVIFDKLLKEYEE